MINSNETIPPGLAKNKAINASETLPPGGLELSKNSLCLSSGESIADSYIINSPLSAQGKQSTVYLAKKWGKTYVVKLYHNGWHPSEQMRQFLTDLSHPNIADIVECGDYKGQYYEIYEYYSEGTLDSIGAVSSSMIQDVIVPSINEGLHELHRNAIVHCDIKPSNLYLTDNGRRVVIGDCGISGYINANGKLVDAVRGTPEYAPRVRALLWSAAMSPAYDYGSFGLVICKMILGHSLFEGMSVEEISRAWENGIRLPSQIEGRLSTLVKGLINEDENERWGYIQVKRWCEGEYMRPVNRNIYQQTRRSCAIRPLIFGRFDNETITVTSLHQLSNAIKKHWEQGTRIVKRWELIEFVRQFNKGLGEKVRPLSLYQDLDVAVFKLLLLIDDENEEIFYCGKKYASLKELIKSLSTGKDDIAKRFLSSGLLVYYLREKNAERSQVDKLEQLIKKSGCNDMASISAICFLLQGKKTINVFGTEISTLKEIVPVISRRKIDEINKLIESDQFKAWLYRLGYEKDLKAMNELQ